MVSPPASSSFNWSPGDEERIRKIKWPQFYPIYWTTEQFLQLLFALPMTFINQLSFSYYHPESPYNVKKNQPFCIDAPFCDGTITNLPSLVIMLTPFCKNWATWSFSWMPHISYHLCDSLYIFFGIAIYWLFFHYLQPDNLYLLSSCLWEYL